MRILTGNEISTILRNLTPEDARRLCDLLSSGLALYTSEKSRNDGEKLLHQPLRTVFQTQNLDTTLVMPVSNSQITAVKVATVPHRGDISGAITLYKPNGDLEGVLNAAEITAFRTALATMTLLTRWSAPNNAEAVVFGAGKQAEWNIRLTLLLVPEVQRITVFNRGKTRLQKFNKEVLDQLKDMYSGVKFEAHSQEGNSAYLQQLTQQLASGHIISCCTPSTEPLFTAKDLQADPSNRKFLSLIGSYKPGMQEVDTETIRLADKIWVDSKESCFEEAGELIRAKLQADDLIEVGDLFSRDVIAEGLFGKDSPLTVFKCVGMGIMDLVISKALLDMGTNNGIGTVLESF